MQVSYRDDNNGCLVLAVNQSIWETNQKALTQSGCNFGARLRERYRAPDRPIDRIEELPSQPFRLRVIPVNRVVEFLLSQGEEPDSHRERCLAITLAYETARDRPVL